MKQADNAIWFAKVTPSVQGRVFAARSLLLQLVSAFGLLIAGPLSDNVFTPALAEGGSLTNIFGEIFGSSAGAGIALLYTICAVCMLLVGIAGFCVSSLQDVERILPDHDELQI